MSYTSITQLTVDDIFTPSKKSKFRNLKLGERIKFGDYIVKDEGKIGKYVPVPENHLGKIAPDPLMPAHRVYGRPICYECGNDSSVEELMLFAGTCEQCFHKLITATLNKQGHDR